MIQLHHAAMYKQLDKWRQVTSAGNCAGPKPQRQPIFRLPPRRFGAMIGETTHGLDRSCSLHLDRFCPTRSMHKTNQVIGAFAGAMPFSQVLQDVANGKSMVGRRDGLH
jgi:hypothetical protein